MKKPVAFFISLALLVPSLALAQAPERPLRADVRAEVRASTTPASLPKLGPAIRDIASTTRALSSSTIEMVRARVDAIKQLIAQKRADSQKRADDAKAAARARFGEQMGQLVGSVSARLASTSAGLSSIADRIDSRIDALKAQGLDLDGSIGLLATARADLSLADDRVLAVNAALEAAMGTTTPKAAMPQVRAAVKAAEDALALAKQDLQKALSAVKVEAAATSTSAL